MSLWLTPAEVIELTAKVRFTAQCRELAKMGIPFLPNAIGRPLVEQAHVSKGAARPKPKREPNWDAIKSRAA